MNIFCNAKGNVFYASAEKIYQGSIGVNEVCFIGEFPSSAQVLMAYRLPNGDYRPPIMLVRETTLDEVQDTRGGLWSVWKGRIGAVPKIEDGEMVKDENGQIVYDLDPTITEHYGTASLRFFVYGANGKIATEEVNFTIEKGLPIYLDINDLTTTTSAELLLEQILAVVNSLQTTDNGLRDDIELLRSELGVNVGVFTSDIAEVSKKVNDLSEQAVKTTDKGVPNGVASLNGAGKIPQEQLPDGIGGGETLEGYRLIEDITLTEDVLTVAFDKDNDNKQLRLKNIFVLFIGEFAKTVANCPVILKINDGVIYQMWNIINITADKKCIYWVHSKREKLLPDGNRYIWMSQHPSSMLTNVDSYGNAQGLSANDQPRWGDISLVPQQTINKVEYGTRDANATAMKAGSRIIIWGVDDD